MTRRATGVDRFALELLRAVVAQRPDWSMQLVAPKNAVLACDAPYGLGVRRLGAGGGHRWEQMALPRLAGDQVLLNLCNTAPLLRQKQLVVIHDVATLANPENFSFAFRSWYRVMLAALMRRAHVIATVSRFSAAELTRLFGARQSGLEVIYEGGEHILREPADESVIDRLMLRERRYVLAVGSQSPNKNVATVAHALDLLDEPDLLLVAVGGSNSRIFADAAMSHARVISAGYVSDQQLRALYEHAACFVFPSFYEGFGLPPLEAMCCGCPVVVSDRASLPEICGDAALYCNPDDPETLARQLRVVLKSPSACQELCLAGRERAALFSWERTARRFIEIMEANFQASCL